MKLRNSGRAGAPGLFMSTRQNGLDDDVARKWFGTAERRRAHVVALRDSGRRQHYYSWEELLDAPRDAVSIRDEWARIAGVERGEAAKHASAARLRFVPQRSERLFLARHPAPSF